MTRPQKKYNHIPIEKKWQKEWGGKKVYKTSDSLERSKFYVLDMFPYPSGEGLHVGHPKGYIATDIISRMKRMQGKNVLHPMGFDAFGLPAENYAIKTKTNPAVSVAKNVARYKKQLEILGLDYDWSREVNTTDPAYYRWTQWIFLKLFEKGLAYESYEPINWCPSCKTGLANEDVEDGKCERCGTPVEKKPMRQWVLKITDYAERLLKDLDFLDWPKSITESQKNWIGKSEGVLIKFKVESGKLKVGEVEVFTTRADTLFGVTYIVLSPESKLVQDLKPQISNWDEVIRYIVQVKKKTEIERTDAKKEKTGIELKGFFAINPANKEKVPVWIADYVLADYGTGAVMAVPAHDERDRDFAEKYRLPIVDRPLISASDILKTVGGKTKTTYKLRDWVFSRQRYWGEPIPVIHCVNCALQNPSGQGIVAVPEKDLPVVLPKVKSYEPTGTGESPLAGISKWVNVKCPKCGGKGKRETNTMPQWAGSSWYYLRYMDPKNDKKLVDPKKEKYWSPVDFYVGGAEHATRHLIYARFWHKFLKDIGVVSTIEPFTKLQHVGLIMGEDGRKMSKRFGNVVNPDDIVKTYGADTLRVYEMFLGPFDQSVAWSTDSIIGPRRFLERVWKILEKVESACPPLPDRPQGQSGDGRRGKLKVEKQDISPSAHALIKKVSSDIAEMKFNTAISAMMMFVNEMDRSDEVSKNDYGTLLKVLAPFAPHITEELWNMLGHKNSIHLESWPVYNEGKIASGKLTIAVQVNGKLRGTFEIESNTVEEVVKSIALGLPEVKKWLNSGVPKKIIYVKGRLVSIVI